MTTNTMISSQYSDFGDFITKHNAKALGKEITHTRIPSQELNIYGGSFHIDKEELSLFYFIRRHICLIFFFQN